MTPVVPNMVEYLCLKGEPLGRVAAMQADNRPNSPVHKLLEQLSQAKKVYETHDKLVTNGDQH